MLATKKCAGLLEAMPDDADSAMIAGWCERMNGAFEAIKGMCLAVHRDLKGFVVVVAAGFTCRHDVHLSLISVSNDDVLGRVSIPEIHLVDMNQSPENRSDREKLVRMADTAISQHRPP
jgi:hypothetical protein